MKRTTKPIEVGLAAALLLATAACSGPVEPAPSAQEASFERAGDLHLSIGETKVVPGTSVRVTFVGVAEDSRCPVDVVCVWQGNVEAVLDLEVAGSGPAVRAHLNTAVEPDAVGFGGLTFTIAAVRPLPYDGREIDPEDYRIALGVEDGEGAG